MTTPVKYEVKVQKTDKTFDQLIRQSLTVREYGRWIAEQKVSARSKT